MSTSKREVQQRKAALLRDLRLAHQHGVALPGEMALSLRQLSAKYGLSMRTIAIELKKLIEEGVLYTVPRVGTFVGAPPTARAGVFLALFRYLDESNSLWDAVRAGFEERIAAFGGASFTLDFDTAARLRASGEMPAPAGIFEFHDDGRGAVWHDPALPHVEFGELGRVHPGSDAVYFHNEDGGWKATRHLLALGHTRIAFMALHGEAGDPGVFLWSSQRQAGWGRALAEAGLDTEGLAFHPGRTPALDARAIERLSARTAARILRREDITAVVAVNVHAARALFATLRDKEVPAGRWPAIVGFDADAVSTDAGAHIVTALRLPWEEIGRQAADLLWERSCGRLHGPEQRLVPMTLIPRLSSRREWHHSPRFMELVRNQETPAA